jgi:glucose-1-phosphate adenylyltransferase
MQRDVLSIILGGGRGSRLYPLTMLRSKPAVPIAGKYRLIDIPISNCINSGCNRIYVLTQFLSVSLHRHIANTYKFDPFSRGFVEILAAQQTNEASDWYQGTADAVRQNVRYIHEDPCQDILILSGDQLYRMDYRQMYQTHRDSKADVTLAVLPVNAEASPGFGIVKLDETGRVNGFIEKPQAQEQLAPFHTPSSWIDARGIASNGRNYLASMGIYFFNRETLFSLLNAAPLATDFGKEIFPRIIGNLKVQAHLFDGYWEDVGTIKSYHDANLALCSPNPPFEFNSSSGVIFTRARYLPASRVNAARLENALISDGCVIGAGTTIQRCVVGIRTQIGRNVTLRNNVILGADRIESPAEKEANKRRGVPDLGIGDGTIIENAILDKDCCIGEGVQIVNRDKVKNGEGKNFVIQEGIVVIPKGAVVEDGTII